MFHNTNGSNAFHYKEVGLNNMDTEAIFTLTAILWFIFGAILQIYIKQKYYNGVVDPFTLYVSGIIFCGPIFIALIIIPEFIQHTINRESERRNCK